MKWRALRRRTGAAGTFRCTSCCTIASRSIRSGAICCYVPVAPAAARRRQSCAITACRGCSPCVAASRHSSPEAGSGPPDLPVTVDEILVARQLLDPDRAARMELVGRDADLRTHAELAAVRELRGRVVQDNRTVDQ